MYFAVPMVAEPGWKLSTPVTYGLPRRFIQTAAGMAYAAGTGASSTGYSWDMQGLWFRRSYDYGQSWTEPVEIDCSSLELPEARALAVAPSNDNVLYVAGVDLGWGCNNLSEEEYSDAFRLSQ